MNKNLLKQAQQLQARLEQAKKDLETATVEASVGGGMVTVVATGDMTIQSIKINKDVIEPDESDMLEDLVLAGVNEALTMAQNMANEKMSSLTGGLNLPGLS
ncbi:MAG: YbaB/EbfC family nucleoid-associated protein [Chloroflexi bacterium]|nr:YbaB/EbfC family nucleoid-associated protein [Chloroflexota bacterium]|tara:strand:- start:2481 stop:2786 length:306 start_codon:yes stop_codon:yes gene_type:complete